MNPLFLFKVFGPLALLAGLWLFHTSAVHTARNQGRAEIQQKWDAREKLLAEATSKQLAAAAEERKSREASIQAQRTSYETALKDLDSRLSSSRDAISRLRNAAISSPRPPSTPLDPGSVCTAHEERIRGLESLLREGQQLSIEGGELLGEGEKRVGELTLRLTSLQDYISQTVRPK